MKKKPGVIDTWRRTPYKAGARWVHEDVEKKYVSVVYSFKYINIFFNI